MSNHRGMCRKSTNPNVRNLNSLSNPHSTIEWGAAEAPTASMPESASNQWHNTSEDPTLSLSRTARERTEPQEEALGYDNTILLSSKSLTETGRKAIDLDTRSKHDIGQVHEVDKCNTLEHETEDTTSFHESSTSSPVLFRDIYPPNDVIVDDVSSGDDSDDSNYFLDEADDHIEEDDEDPILLDAERCDDDSWGSYKSCNGEGLHFQAKPEYEEGSLPLIYVAFTDLLWRLDHHKVDLNVFDEIIEWVTHFSKVEPTLFAGITKSTKTTRKTMLKYLRDTFKREDLHPTIKDVKLPSGTMCTIPQFDFRALATDILTNPELMDPINYVKENFDCQTFKPIIPVHGYIPHLTPNSTRTIPPKITEIEKELAILRQNTRPTINKKSEGLKIEFLSHYTLPDGRNCQYWDTGSILNFIQSTNTFAQVNVRWDSNTRFNSPSCESTVALKYTLWNGIDKDA